MIRDYTIYFVIGGDMTTWNISASSPQKALEKVGGNVIGVSAPGYKIVKDEDYGKKIKQEIREEFRS